MHGANFATVSSTIEQPNLVIPQNGGFIPFYLDVQASQFLRFRQIHSRDETYTTPSGKSLVDRLYKMRMHLYVHVYKTLFSLLTIGGPVPDNYNNYFKKASSVRMILVNVLLLT